FFFSSRRRHTIFSRDWSSDVCSSDLVLRSSVDMQHTDLFTFSSSVMNYREYLQSRRYRRKTLEAYLHFNEVFLKWLARENLTIEIGRASCRERLKSSVDVGDMKRIRM